MGRRPHVAPNQKINPPTTHIGDDALTPGAAPSPHADKIPQNFRTVIVAAAVGNVIEWYDFYIFGSLAAVLSVKFFEKSHPVAALLSTIATGCDFSKNLT